MKERQTDRQREWRVGGDAWRVGTISFLKQRFCRAMHGKVTPEFKNLKLGSGMMICFKTSVDLYWARVQIRENYYKHRHTHIRSRHGCIVALLHVKACVPANLCDDPWSLFLFFCV